MKQKNAFGKEIPEIKELLRDEKVKGCVTKMLLPVLKHLGFKNQKAEAIIGTCLDLATEYSNLLEYEKSANSLLERESVTTNIPRKLKERAERIYSQVNPYILDGNVIDFGCGDGRVGQIISGKGLEVQLTDVYKNKNIDQTNLPFKLFKQGESTPFRAGQFMNTLALTVFHHSNNPSYSVSETARMTKSGGRILVIESVYGVNGENLSAEERRLIKSYLSLNNEQQRMVNIFFDHFYNRVIHYSNNTSAKVNVPFNFNTPEEWKKIFESHGLIQEKVIHLGVDQLAVPEYHTLHVLRKKG